MKDGMKKMKRSDFINKLYTQLENLEANGGHDLATKITDIIEQLGMTPPLEPYRCVEDCDLGLPQWELEEYEGSKYDPEGEWGE